jgi:hypothetical protein
MYSTNHPDEYVPTHKYCRRCFIDKPLAEFPTNKRVSDGRSSWCRLCHNEAKREYRADKKRDEQRKLEPRPRYESMWTQDRSGLLADDIDRAPWE